MYTDTPLNYEDFSVYLITDMVHITKYLLADRTCFFYDTCTFLKHADLPTPDPVFFFIKRRNGIVIITGCILMELTSSNHELNPKYIRYLKSMHDAGLTVLLLLEENLLSVLDSCFGTTIAANNCLSWAIRALSLSTSTIHTVFQENPELRNSVLRGDTSDRSLFHRFFSSVRAAKTPGDNLGEELLIICAHVLSNLPSAKEWKYLILTEDKGIFRLLEQANTNLFKQYGKYNISVLTTPRLAQRLHEENLLSTAKDIETFLISGGTDNEERFRIWCSETYDIYDKELSLTARELAEKLINPEVLRIKY